MILVIKNVRIGLASISVVRNTTTSITSASALESLEYKFDNAKSVDRLVQLAGE